tara:strand:+ start:180 stop:401 length:222 start_codon:yes stop_codon:yes gene_type:complete
MSSIFSPKMPALPPVQPLPTPPSTEVSPEEKRRIAAEQAAIERKRKGRKSTILTGPLGPEEEAETEKKTLLGE